MITSAAFELCAPAPYFHVKPLLTRPFPRFGALLLLAVVFASLPVAGKAQTDDDGLPANLSHGLHPLVRWHQSEARSLDAMGAAEHKAALDAKLGRNGRRIQTDAEARVVVNVRLDGSVPAETVKKSLAALGAVTTSEHVARRADGRDGLLAVHLPLGQAVAAAKTPGVFSVLTAARPHRRVGRVTSQGVAVLQADAVQAQGYSGKGITVGVLSDSYNVATEQSAGATITTHAADDVASGDLPGTNNPDGYTTPIVVLQDGSTDPSAGNEDEGRAMLQIIHDVAPGANLAFCTAGETVTDFAQNILSLRTNPTAPCDVIVDDIGFDDEPFFSDSVVAQAVDEAVTSTTLRGRPVIYYSAAGNDGDLSYAANYTPVSDAEGRASKVGNLRLDTVPTSLTAGGFHNFKAADTGSGEKIVQKVTVSQSDAYINFQWDDPFLSRGVTTSYCLLVFDANGNFIGDGDNNTGGIDNNFSTGEALQTVYLPLSSDGSDTDYQLVISRRAGGTGQATHLKYIVEDASVVIGKYLHTGKPTLFGHSGAANADGVAAYDVHNPMGLPESYESYGPVTLYLDENGNRLTTPVVRQQPTIATVDGVDTTFFAPGDLSDTDSDNDGYPNFYGTSAAAPHAAGVAALLLQAAGGKGALSAAQMRSLLESTAGTHDLDPAFAVASFSSPDGQIKGTVTAAGDDSNNSAYDQKFFTVTFTGPAGASLRKMSVDISTAGEVFDLSTDDGYPFTIGEALGVAKEDVIASLSNGADTSVGGGGKITLLFARARSFREASLLSASTGTTRCNPSTGTNLHSTRGAIAPICSRVPRW